jgi:hypothetical protein
LSVHGARARDGAHAVLGHADILEQSGQFPHDPVRHAFEPSTSPTATAIAPMLADPPVHDQMPIAPTANSSTSSRYRGRMFSLVVSRICG